MKEIENMFSVLLSSYRNTRESLDRNTVHVFYFLNNNNNKNH